MKAGIMQPYFFPYIGYWQLLNTVDRYVVYDDVNYEKGGWINRNRVIVNKAPKYINLKIAGISQNRLINELDIDQDPVHISKTLKMIEQNYKKAPYYDESMELIEVVITNPQRNLAAFLFDQIRMVAEHLSMNTEIILSSSIEKDCSLRGEQKVIAICQAIGADTYYNSIGGRRLYSKENFEQRGIMLKFLEADIVPYKQFCGEFFGSLSIIDVLMFNGKEGTRRMLDHFKIID